MHFLLLSQELHTRKLCQRPILTVLFHMEVSLNRHFAFNISASPCKGRLKGVASFLSLARLELLDLAREQSKTTTLLYCFNYLLSLSLSLSLSPCAYRADVGGQIEVPE